ncbi:MAG: glycosyltransferase family 2 protein [Dehalococcoidia bacterium]|nr:glycosyltransferase family 2 protein [Dehalococcoidia bacterium]
MTPELSLIVPTYNEADNIEALVSRVHETLASCCRYELIVVDDDSPDGTAEAARYLSSQYPVKVIVRRGERGLASAIAEGFGHAHGDVLGVMDADLKHPPEKIPDLLRYIRNGADVAIGSRYEPGGGTEKWTWQRQLVSRVARSLAHLLLPSSKKVSDPLSGFFLLRRKVIQGIELNPTGYKILLEVLVRGKARQVACIPYTFRGREAGDSKYGIREQVNYLRHLLRLLPADGGVRRFIKFCLVGSSGVLVNMGLLWLLTEVAGLFYLASAAIAIGASIINNFVLNDSWTFRDRRTPGMAARLMRFLKFNLVSAVGIGINMGILWSCTELLGVYYLLSNLFGIGAAMLWNFTANASWTWKPGSVTSSRHRIAQKLSTRVGA